MRFPPKPPGSSISWGRFLRRLLALSLLGSGLAVVPFPTLAWAESVEIQNVVPPLEEAPARPAAASRTQRLLDDDGAVALAQPDRVRALERDLEEFSVFAASLRRPPAEPVLYRVRSAGAWGPWRELGFSEGHGEDQSTRRGRAGVHSEPVWVDQADGYELDLPAGSRAEVHLGHDVRRQVLAVRPRAATAGPAILTREQWGARPPAATPTIASDMRIGVVHHSVTANGYSPSDVPSILRGIQAYHMDVQGWNDIAYNFAVDGFGRTWEARGGGIANLVVGGHAAGFNTGSVGVVMLGDFTSVPPSEASVQAVGNVLGWKFALGGIEPVGTVPFTTTGGTKYSSGTTVTLPRIVGHRDVGSTGCPGQRLFGRLDTIRSVAASRYLVEADATMARPLIGNFVGAPGDDALIERLGRQADALWSWTGAGFSKKDYLAYGSYRPAAGDFDGDGFDDVLWHGSGSINDYSWLGGLTGFRGGPSPTIAGSFIPHVGDFDGDGRDDVYLYAEGLADDTVLYGNLDGSFTTVVRPSNATYEPSVGDFDGDGRDDVFMHDPGNASHPIFYGEANRTFTVRTPSANGAFQPFLGDFNADGRTDIFWYTPNNDGDWIYFGTVGRGFTAKMYQAIGYFIPLVGDFIGDNADDVLWYSPGALHQAYWKFNISGPVGSSVDVNGHFIPSVLDVDLDGVDDILWYSPAGSATWRGTPLGFRGYGA
ncbi:MAG: FG-GAP-like repeat-containing protein [Microthrixaceae bacterium]